jgi:hypothetical protein
MDRDFLRKCDRPQNALLNWEFPITIHRATAPLWFFNLYFLVLLFDATLSFLYLTVISSLLNRFVNIKGRSESILLRGLKNREMNI